jgi:hypothetical protein
MLRADTGVAPLSDKGFPNNTGMPSLSTGFPNPSDRRLESWGKNNPSIVPRQIVSRQTEILILLSATSSLYRVAPTNTSGGIAQSRSIDRVERE